MEISQIFIPIGGIIILTAIVAMIVIHYRIHLEKQEYVRGEIFEDEYGITYERLRGLIPIYGSLLLVGFVVIAVSFIVIVE